MSSGFRDTLAIARAVAMAAAIAVARSAAASEMRASAAPLLPAQTGPSVVSYDPDTATLDVLNVTIGAMRFWDAGVFGQGASVANIEGGIAWRGHESLSHLPESQWIVGEGAAGTVTDHATATAQIIAGLGPTDENGYYSWLSLGVAPLANLWSGDIATSIDPESGAFDISAASYLSTYDRFFGSVDVINSSWGGTGEGAASGTDFLSLALDAMARANPLTTFVVAAGNHGTEPGATTYVKSPASGFNGISVGALGPPHAYDSVAEFSNRGPGDFYNPVTETLIEGVRATVDLSAPGVNVGAAYTTTESTAYFTFSGTSAAAPVVAGGAALLASTSRLLEADPIAVANGWNSDARDARVIKAVLMNTADRLDGWTNHATIEDGVEVREYFGSGVYFSSMHDGVLSTTQGVDFEQGAGRMNLDRAFDGYVGGQWILDMVGYESDRAWTFNREWDAGETVTATLVWFADRQMELGWDYADEEQVASAEASIVNAAMANLDLELWSWDGGLSTLYAVSRSVYNSAEHIVFSVETPGTYALRVTHSGMVFGDADGGEIYALAWNVIPEPTVLALLPLGIALMAIRRRLRRRRV